MTIPVPGDMGPNNEAIAIIGLMMVEVQNKAVLLGRRYQLEQDKAWWKERFEAILADTELPRRWQLRKFWDAFVNLKIEGE